MMSKLAYPQETNAVMITSHLLRCYGSFADRRIKNPSKSRRFIADSRDENNGLASDGDYYGWFCGLWLDVESEHDVTITMENNVPESPAVERALRSLASERTQPGRVAFRITKERTRDLRHLADQIAGIVAPGRRYSTANYRYMCPMTATSLREVAGHLNEFWSAETSRN